LRDAVERPVHPKVLDRVAEGEVAQPFRLEGIVARHE
jgi:hypothetical protein